jgi:hypothetical protein
MPMAMRTQAVADHLRKSEFVDSISFLAAAWGFSDG